MKKIIIALNTIIAIYFFILANLFFWGGLIALFVGTFSKPEWFKNPWVAIFCIIISPFLIYGSINLFRKTKTKYLYCIIVLLVIFLGAQIYRFFFVTQYRLETADAINLLFFGTPILLVLLVKYLDKKIRL